MDDRHLDIAGAARFFLDSCGTPDPPIDPWAMAAMWGFVVTHAPGPAKTRGRCIFHDPARQPWQQRFDVAHELGHVTAQLVGLDAGDCGTASDIAGALLVPERDLKSELSRTAWDLAQLVPRYRVSWEVMARRLPQVAPCVVTIVDNGSIYLRRRSAWLTSRCRPGRGLEAWEDRLVVEAAGSERHVYAENLVTAYSVVSPGWDRVVLVAGAEEWEARTYPLLAAE